MNALLSVVLVIPWFMYFSWLGIKAGYLFYPAPDFQDCLKVTEPCRGTGF